MHACISWILTVYLVDCSSYDYSFRQISHTFQKVLQFNYSQSYNIMRYLRIYDAFNTGLRSALPIPNGTITGGQWVNVSAGDPPQTGDTRVYTRPATCPDVCLHLSIIYFCWRQIFGVWVRKGGNHDLSFQYGIVVMFRCKNVGVI